MMPRFRAQMAYELSEGTLYPLQTFKKSIDNPEMNLGGIYQLDKDTDASFQDGSDKEDDDTQNNPDQDDIFATPWEKEHYLKYFPRQTRPSDRHSPFKRTLIRQIVKELEQLQKVNANWPLENLLDVAYEIEYYLMGLESDVKRQLSLLLSSVNKHIVWPEVSCHDDACQRRKFENFYDVRMTENEWKFLEEQRGERKMYCQDHVDTQWTKTMTRQNNDLFALERMRHSVNAEQPMAVPESTETTEVTSDSADKLYTPVTVEDVEFQSPRKKKKVMEDKNSNASSSMPEEYQHVRCSMQKGRPEYYEVVDKLKSCFHMSQNQAEAAVVETANKMFGRNWKYHDEEAEIDVDTLPDKKNARRVGKCIEATALSEIVTEVVSGGCIL
ncbi:hypothetical protein EMCRGX_G017573 [Ephydatia muelleri]